MVLLLEIPELSSWPYMDRWRLGCVAMAVAVAAALAEPHPPPPPLLPLSPLSPYLVYKLLARVHHVDQCPGSLGGAWLELP